MMQKASETTKKEILMVTEKLQQQTDLDSKHKQVKEDPKRSKQLVKPKRTNKDISKSKTIKPEEQRLVKQNSTLEI